MRMLDLFCGRWGWSKAFAVRGWECVGVDLITPPDIPEGCTFIQRDILTMAADDVQGFDFICASSPCEQFSVHGMKHFHPNPPYPELGIRLFNHTRQLCEAASVPYVMENVRAAQQFVGNAVHHCGSFYLWGTGVPAILGQRLYKGFGNMSTAHYHANLATISPHRRARNVATIPLELSSCVADYAERICSKEPACHQPQS
jgi:hypothetical protein